MTGRVTTRRVLLVVALSACWCGLWQTVSVANIASGLFLATLIVGSGIGTKGEGGVRLVPLAKLAWIVLLDLVSSTADVAIEILTPTDRTEEAIIAVEVPAESRHHLLLLSVAITLTPGTAVVDVDPSNGTLYLHLLHIDRREATEEHVQDLARLACEALPAAAQGVRP